MLFDDVVVELKEYVVWVLSRAINRAQERGIVDPRIVYAFDTVRRYMVLEADEDELMQARSAVTDLVDVSDLAHAAFMVAGMEQDLRDAFSAVEWLRSTVLNDDPECDRELARRLRSLADRIEAQQGEGRQL